MDISLKPTSLAVSEDPVTLQHKDILASQGKKEEYSKKQQATIKGGISTKKQFSKAKAQNLPNVNKVISKHDEKEPAKDMEVEGMTSWFCCCYYVYNMLINKLWSEWRC